MNLELDFDPDFDIHLFHSYLYFCRWLELVSVGAGA